MTMKGMAPEDILRMEQEDAMAKETKSKMEYRICPLCGTHYKEENGHNPGDCWGLIHQQLLEAERRVSDLRYKLQQADKQVKAEGK